MTVIDAYRCHCAQEQPMIKFGEPSGICQTCNGIYDEYIYETRCRTYQAGWYFESVHDYLMTVDPRYAQMARAATA